MNFKEIAKSVKKDSFTMSSLSEEVRNKALQEISIALEQKKESIFAANKKDLSNGVDLPSPILSRLKFDNNKLSVCIQGTSDLINMKDPLFQTMLKRELDDNLTLVKSSCPLGVIGVIFESRPDALVQISTLCIKSGNCAILKGGSEAMETNRALFEIIHAAGVSAGLPSGFVTLVESRSQIDELLKCHEYIDLIIPRGSNEFVQYIMANSKIPVMGHADGICHIYVDKNADIDKAIPIIVDSKTQYVAACNSVETLLLNESIAEEVLSRLSDTTFDLVEGSSKDDYVEHLDYILTVKRVKDLDEAISHINTYGSHHTDCIISENKDAVNKFMSLVDSASVYENCSTRFADGLRYGFGAEVGISTGKLHARGPVGLDGLVTYKFKLYGDGQIVADYSSGKKSFKFKDLI